ncbi:hypothetical protein V8G54_004813 [Vigna mungo]|uniref:Uncharacterized protein n=1 Tax=Vigna mungo TaxID=3915 RepID=A0AAQ3SGG0_VIGMU
MSAWKSRWKTKPTAHNATLSLCPRHITALLHKYRGIHNLKSGFTLILTTKKASFTRERSGGGKKLTQTVCSLVEITTRNWTVRVTVGFCEEPYYCNTKLQGIPSLQALSPFPLISVRIRQSPPKTTPPGSSFRSQSELDFLSFHPPKPPLALLYGAGTLGPKKLGFHSLASAPGMISGYPKEENLRRFIIEKGKGN